MVAVFDAASYVYNRYKKEFKEEIDEMKLHKLLYFAQRESIIQTGEILFEATFSAWKFGPVLKEIRYAYKEKSFLKEIKASVVVEMKPIMDRIFSDYAGKDSWSLSRLTHGEVSWQKSRIGIPEEVNGDRAMAVEDIREDAERIKARREKLVRLGLYKE